jgi:NAD-dependent deacetylase sirtuin 5
MSAHQDDDRATCASTANDLAGALPSSTPSPSLVDKPKHTRKPVSKSSDALKAKQTKRKFHSTTLPLPALNIPLDDFTSFTAALQSSKRIFALIGAGLSASSGLATFRGNDRLWRGIEPQSLSDIDAFSKDPVLVWWFFSDRMERAQGAIPNRGHFALARLAKEKEGFFAVNQNIDGKSRD